MIHDIDFFDIITWIMLATNADPFFYNMPEEPHLIDKLTSFTLADELINGMHLGITGMRLSFARDLGYEGHPFNFIKPANNIKFFGLYLARYRKKSLNDRLEKMRIATPIGGINEQDFIKKRHEVIGLKLVT